MTMTETEKWGDGTDMKCEVCEGPILKGQPRYRSRTQQEKKRSARHFTCSPGSKIVVIGARSMNVGGKTYDEWAVEAIQLVVKAEALGRCRFDEIRCIVNKDGHWFQSFKDGDSAAEAWQEELSAMADSQ
jgi:hypothetical protein